METVCIEELPEDCWELITTRLGDQHQWESLSLVSKKLLSITNRLRVSLKVINPSIKGFYKLLQRFRHVRKIDLSSFNGNLDEALLEIAQSGLNIEELNISNRSIFPVKIKDLGFKMKNIKVLSCSESYLKDSDLVFLAESLPFIEDLDISQQQIQDISDEGIAAMSMKLKRLRSINLSGNTRISDQSIISLSSNCESLTEIVLRSCNNVSQAGISFAMGNSHSYNSLIIAPRRLFSLELTNPLKFSKYITTIDLKYIKIADKLLNRIVEADLPLKNFHLSFCLKFTANGLYALLKAYPYLRSLSLSGTVFLTDESMIHICQFITKLNSIELNYCPHLTGSSFSVITSACPHIQKIAIESLSEGESGPYYALGSAKNPSLTSASLTSITLQGLLHICSNLRVLKVTNNVQPKEVDIAFILKSCHNIRHLTVVSCQSLKFTGEGDKEVFKLEWLEIGDSWIDDEVLKMVGKRCPELLHLNLKGCTSLTERGLREVAEHCRRLRYINLDGCSSVKKNVVAWMVASCPSLRQIVTPTYWDHTKDKLDSFVSQGCLVIPGTLKEAKWVDLFNSCLLE